MKISRVFVSGAAGVIGSQMVPLLAARGFTVLAADLKPCPAHFPPEVQYRQGDLNHMDAAELAGFAPDCFIHLAATFERSAESYGFWEENFRHNLALSHHLMTLAKDLPSLHRVVFASSYLIYDPALYQFNRAQQQPVSLKESDPILPRNLTGMAKLAHEVELRFLDGFRHDKFSSVCARIFRGYGPGSRDVISRWVRSLLQGEPITVFRPEGWFDYIYAKDTAEGLIRLAEAEGLTGIVNLGTGQARRVGEVVAVLKRHFPAMQASESPSDIPFEASQADINLFRSVIGWQPAYDLEKAIPEIIAHERARLTTPETRPAPGHLLVTSASRKIPLLRAAISAARKLSPEMKVMAGDIDPDAPAQYAADAFWVMPRTDDTALDTLVAGCRERGIGFVLPTRDGELAFWARHKARFAEAGIAVLVSPEDSVTRCLDKLDFARFGEERGLPFIPAFEGLEDAGSPPYAVKERFGAGSRAIGLNLDAASAREHARGLTAPIFQPFIDGTEISVDSWLDRNHRVKGLVLRRRDRVVDGESQVTTTFRDAAIEEAARTALETLDLCGPVVLQILIDRAGQPHIIECNSRFGGASTAGIAAGLDSLYWSLAEAAGNDVAALPFARIPGEVRQVRLPADTHFILPE